MNSEEIKNSSSHPYSPEISQIKGELAVDKVLSVLDGLKRRALIKDFGSTDAFGADDRSGIDILVYPKQGKKILLQIKSSYHESEKKKYNKKGIHYLAIPPAMEGYEVEAIVSKILARAAARESRKKKKK